MFILFNDRRGKSHLLPYLNTITVGCVGINCVYDNELNCDKCPFKNHGKLNPGEFKILKPKNKK